MPSSFWLSKLRRGVVSLINGDSSLQTALGRATKLCLSWQALQSAIAAADGLPVITYYFPGEFVQTDEDGSTWLGAVRFTVWFDGTDALDAAEAAAALLMAAFTTNALQTTSTLDVGVGNVWKALPTEPIVELTDVDPNRVLARVDLEVDLNVYEAA